MACEGLKDNETVYSAMLGGEKGRRPSSVLDKKKKEREKSERRLVWGSTEVGKITL